MRPVWAAGSLTYCFYLLLSSPMKKPLYYCPLAIWGLFGLHGCLTSFITISNLETIIFPAPWQYEAYLGCRGVSPRLLPIIIISNLETIILLPPGNMRPVWAAGSLTSPPASIYYYYFQSIDCRRSRVRFPGWVKTFPHLSHLWQGKAVDSWRGRWLWSDRASMLDSAPGDHQLRLENSSNPFGVPCIFTNNPEPLSLGWSPFKNWKWLFACILEQKSLFGQQIIFQHKNNFKKTQN